MIGELPAQSFHNESGRPVACDACRGVVDSIVRNYRGVSPSSANSEALKEFEEMVDDRVCVEDFICMPLRRLQQTSKK